MQKDITPTPSVAQAIPTEPKKRNKARKFFRFIFLLTLAGLIYSQYQLYLIKNPGYQEKVAQEQVQAVVDKVGKLMLLPKDMPQVLVLQEVEKIKSQQPFFKDAENGDQVLVYATTAIIYSPSKNKIVNVGPVVRDPQVQTGTNTNTQQNTAVEANATSTKTPAKPAVKTN